MPYYSVLCNRGVAMAQWPQYSTMGAILQQKGFLISFLMRSGFLPDVPFPAIAPANHVVRRAVFFAVHLTICRAEHCSKLYISPSTSPICTAFSYQSTYLSYSASLLHTRYGSSRIGFLSMLPWPDDSLYSRLRSVPPVSPNMYVFATFLYLSIHVVLRAQCT